ncbi:hypothetical protein ACIG3E_32710 [Streptomyces sp. NPDC053474]|uniref:hypothetical protein n=1 Tax=Streptomyces sp. NPDC053474 TaxID=3365704 RepID=UPI0037D7EC09
MATPSSIRTLADLMTANGWSASVQDAGAEARVEGTHEDGAAAMATARLTDKGWRLRLYAIGSGQRAWARVQRDAFTRFLETGELEGTHRPVPTKCTCRKSVSAPTKARALRQLKDAQDRHRRAGAKKVEARVYRCPHDARRWHLTSMAKWAGRDAWRPLAA